MEALNQWGKIMASKNLLLKIGLEKNSIDFNSLIASCSQHCARALCGFCDVHITAPIYPRGIELLQGEVTCSSQISLTLNLVSFLSLNFKLVLLICGLTREGS